MQADRIEMVPVSGFGGRIRPPGSKSITNRALVCAALARGTSRLAGALDSEDTEVMIDSLGRLGIAIQWQPDHVLSVAGCGGVIPANDAELFVANSGTTMRFLAGMTALAQGTFRLDGTARMRERPIVDLVDALRSLGVEASCLSAGGCPPVLIRSQGLAGGQASIAGSVSSQFLSGLLLAAPYARQPVTLSVAGELVSKPYVEMTLAVMRSFGAIVEHDDLCEFRIGNLQRYHGQHYSIEPDASAASYFFAAAAITGSSVTVEGLGRDSLQGDVRFCDCLAAMGCQVEYGASHITVRGNRLRGDVQFDMNAISDTVQTLAAVALFADGPVTITGVGHIRHKETDRIGNLAVELRKLGALVDEANDGLRIDAGQHCPAEIATYNDHRMAMSLALVGLKRPGVVILDPGCTRKTYPEFFADLESLAQR